MPSLNALCEIDETTIFHGIGYTDPVVLDERSIELHGETILYYDTENCIRPTRSTENYSNFFHAVINFIPDIKKENRFPLVLSKVDSSLYIGELIMTVEENSINVGAYFEWTSSCFLDLSTMRNKKIEMEITYDLNESNEFGKSPKTIR